MNTKILLQLLRLDKPIGIFLLLWPSMWTLWFCYDGKPPLTLLAWIIAGVIIARSAGCIVNDIFDADIDYFVTRTKNRPIAKGLCSKKHASWLFIILMTAAAAIAWHLSVMISSSITALAMTIYPKFKRFFAVPQLWLALTWSMSVIVVWDACQIDFSYSIAFLFLTSFFWTLAFDTLYAIADRADDRHLNINSMAIWLAEKDLLGISICYLGMLGSWILFALSLENYHYCFAGTSFALIFVCLILLYCAKRNPLKCLSAFKANQWLGCYLWLLIFLK